MEKIECKSYKCAFYSDITCIKNQMKLTELEKSGFLKRKNRNGTYQILWTAPPVEFFRIKECYKCETGIKLYTQAKKENRLPKEKKIPLITKQKTIKIKDYLFLSKLAMNGLNSSLKGYR